MKSRLSVLVSLIVPIIIALAPTQSSANTYGNGQITVFLNDARSCAFLQLNGVPEADPAVAGNPWFALPKSNPSYQEMFAELLTAKLSGKQVYVQTDGTISCGFATLSLVQINP